MGKLFSKLSQIGYKLFLSFSVIIGLSLIAFILALHSLNNTKSVQTEVVNKTLPFLEATQNLTNSVFNYIIIVERMVNNNMKVDRNEKKQIIRDQERVVQSHIKALSKSKDYRQDIEEVQNLLTKMFKNTRVLEQNLLDNFTEIQEEKNRNLQRIKLSASVAMRELKRHQVRLEIKGTPAPIVTGQLTEDLRSILVLAGQLENERRQDVIRKLKINYMNKVRAISQSMFLISDTRLKTALADRAYILYGQLETEEGIFHDALELSKILNDASQLVIEYKEKQRQLNEIIKTLTGFATQATKADIGQINTTIDQTIYTLFLLIAGAFTLSLATLSLYVRPKIVNRIKTLSAKTKEIAAGNYNIDIDISGHDEITQMSHALKDFKSELIAKKEIESKIAENEYLLRNIIENAIDGLISINAEGLIESFNPACEKMFGYKKEEVLGRNIKILMPHNHARSHDNYMRAYYLTGERKRIGKWRELEALHKNGSTFPIELSVSKVKNDDKIIFTGIMRDITKRKKAERRIQESEERYDLAVRGSSVGLWDWDVITDQMYWSPRFRNILGIVNEDFVPYFSHIEQRLHSEDHDFAMNILSEHLNYGTPYDLEYRLRHEEGHYIWVHARGQAIWNEDGRPVRMAGSIDDVCDKKISEVAVKESQKFLELVMDSNPDFLFVKDKNFKIIEANKAFLEVYPEERRSSIIGSTTIEDYNEEDAETFLKQDKIAFEKGFSAVTEKIVFPDGKQRTVYMQKVRFKNSYGEPFILGIARDVTERENLIHKLTESNEELERFAYVASHDLQEPLRIIRNFTQLLQTRCENQLDDKAKKYIDISVDSAVRMQELIEDLLDYARLGGAAEKYEEIDLENILKYAMSNLERTIQETNAVITYDALPSLFGNAVQLSRVLQNLICNGLKYQAKNGGAIPKIHVSVESTPKDWIFGVRDNGIGMKQKYCEQIFTPFKRLHGRQEYSGTGMGLAICRKIVENKGGKIWAESEPNAGTTVFFTIPKDKHSTPQSNIKAA